MNTSAVQLTKPANCSDGGILVIDDESGHPLIDDFRHRSGSEGDNRCAAGHCLDHDQTKRLRPVDWKQQSCRGAEKVFLRLLVDLAGELDLLAIDQRLESLFEMAPVRSRYFRCDTERHAGCPCNPNRRFRSLFSGKTAEKCKILSRSKGRAKPIGRQSMVDGAEPVCFTKWPALVIRYRDERRVWKLADDFRQSGQIQSSVQGRH